MSVKHQPPAFGVAHGLIALWLGCLLPMSAAAQDDDLGEDEDKASRSSDESAAQGDADSAEAKPATTEPASEVESGPSVLIQPYVGFGIAMRSFQRPTSVGIQKLSASAVPGAEVGLGIVAWPAASFSLGFNLAYQTALGFTVVEMPPFALQNRVHARSERVALDIAPTWRLGAVSLGVPIGLSMRTLWPEAHMLMTPGYSLIGPHARIELTVRVSGALTLRIAPEGQWITLIDESLRATGVSPQGVAVGGEASFNYAFSTHWQAGVSYRESHALIATNRDAGFQDVERYLTVRGTGSF
jgi:hypothetical protein